MRYTLHNTYFWVKRGVIVGAAPQKVKQFNGAINQKNKINNVALERALSLDKPGFSDKLKVDNCLVSQKTLHQRMIKIICRLCKNKSGKSGKNCKLSKACGESSGSRQKAKRKDEC